MGPQLPAPAHGSHPPHLSLGTRTDSASRERQRLQHQQVLFPSLPHARPHVPAFVHPSWNATRRAAAQSWIQSSPETQRRHPAWPPRPLPLPPPSSASHGGHERLQAGPPQRPAPSVPAQRHSATPTEDPPLLLMPLMFVLLLLLRGRVYVPVEPWPRPAAPHAAAPVPRSLDIPPRDDGQRRHSNSRPWRGSATAAAAAIYGEERRPRRYRRQGRRQRRTDPSRVAHAPTPRGTAHSKLPHCPRRAPTRMGLKKPADRRHPDRRRFPFSPGVVRPQQLPKCQRILCCQS